MNQMKYFWVFLAFFLTATRLQAVELNATVTVNSDRVPDANKSMFASMQKAMDRLINETKWSGATFGENERIDCSFSLVITTQTDNSFKAELTVQARRPVYNSSYVTTTLNYRDTKVDFDYMANQILDYNENMIDNNLIAVLAFYCNLILAQDFDSFSLYGGTTFYREAQNIATQAQSNSSWTGWSAFDDTRSRTSIINIFLDDAVKPFREFWYTYHLKGLDQMAANPDRARTTILTALPVLKDIRNVRNSEVLLQMFSDCKLSEIVSIASNATTEEKQSAYNLLQAVFPASSTALAPLTK